MTRSDDDGGALEPNREDDPDAWFRQQVEDKVTWYKIAKMARTLVNNESAIRQLNELPTRPVLLSDGPPPRTDARPRITGILGSGHNALLMATRKAGKTVLAMNLVRALVDGVPFLDRFDVRPLDGTAVYLNYELADWQSYEWFSRLGIRNDHQVVVQTLRGLRLPIMTDEGAAWLISYLKNADAEFVIMDTAAKAFKSAGGTDENSNAEVLDFLLRLDEIKAEAGVSELVLPIHTNRENPHRVRGASMWEDHVDMIWRLSRTFKKGDPAEFETKEGRDLDKVSGKLAFDEATKRLSWTTDDEPVELVEEVSPDVEELVSYVTTHEGQPKEKIFKATPWGRSRFNHAVDQAVECGRVAIRPAGQRKLMYPVELGSSDGDVLNRTQPVLNRTQPVERTQPLNHSTAPYTRMRRGLSGGVSDSDELSDDEEAPRPARRTLDFSNVDELRPDSRPARLTSVDEFWVQAERKRRGTRKAVSREEIRKWEAERVISQESDDLNSESYDELTAATKGVDE